MVQVKSETLQLNWNEDYREAAYGHIMIIFIQI